jgi:protein-disulfide isomerase/uncharacterized membrane protein
MLGKKSGRVVLVLAILLAFAGWFLSWQLYLLHMRGKTGAAGFIAQGCSARETFNCEAVADSKWGTMAFFGYRVSTSVAGAVYFGTLLIWYLFVGRPNRRSRFWHLLPLGAASAGICFSAFFTYILFTKLSTLCPWCLVCHAANLGLFVCTVLLWPRKSSPPPASFEPESAAVQDLQAPAPARYPSVRLALAGCALTVVFVVVQLLFSLYYETLYAKRGCQLEVDRLMKDDRVKEALAKSQKRMTLPWRDDDPVLGERNAPETLTLFSDFQCPSCHDFHRKLPDLIKMFRGRLRVIFKHNPLNTDCNPHLDRNVHPDACAAACAAEAARVVGGNDAFWKMADLLFENQGGLKRLDYDRLASQLGLDPARFKTVMNSDAVKSRIREDLDLAFQAGCFTTPDMYRNDIHFTEWYGLASAEAWRDWARQSREEAASRPAATQTRPSATRPTASAPAFNANAVRQSAISLRPDEAFRGSADAPNTLVLFYSFSSNACRSAHLNLVPHLEKVFGGTVKFTVRHMPVDPACNPYLGPTQQPRSCEAARAVEAARQIGGPEVFWKMIDLLFRNQAQLSDVDWTAFASQLGLDPVKLLAAMNDTSVIDRIAQDVELAHRLRLSHVPAFYLNDTFMDQPTNLYRWKELAERLLPPPVSTHPAATAPARSAP